MLELIFQGFMEWAYGLTLECWEYFSSSLLSIMSMDYAYMKSHVPVMVSIAQVLLAVGWALLIRKAHGRSPVLRGYRRHAGTERL